MAKANQTNRRWERDAERARARKARQERAAERVVPTESIVAQPRSKDTNLGAVNRKRRRDDTIPATEATTTGGASGAGGIFGGGGIDQVTVQGFATGWTIPPGEQGRARRSRFSGNDVGVDNAGEFDGPDTVFE